MRKLGLFILLHSCVAFADHSEQTHFAAHFGMSYALTTIGYGVCKKSFHLDSIPAFVVAAGAALAIGFAYKGLEISQGGTWQSVPRAMGQNTLGVVGAGISFVAFDF